MASRDGKARQEAIRFAKETRHLARRYQRRLGKETREEIEAAALELEKAAEGEENKEQLSGALARLGGLWEKHLAFTQKGFLPGALLLIVLALIASLLVRFLVVEPFRIPSGSMAPVLIAGDHILVDKLAYGPRLPFASQRLVQLGNPRRGDVIVFVDPRDPRRDFVKRVVGLPGDKIEIREQALYVNDVPQRRSSQGQLVYQDFSERTHRWSSESCPAFSEELVRGPILPPASDRPDDLEASFRTAAISGLVRHTVLQCGNGLLGDRQGPFTVSAGTVFVMGDNRDRSDDSRSSGGWLVPFENVKGKVTRVAWSWGKGGRGIFGEEGVRVERVLRRIE